MFSLKMVRGVNASKMEKYNLDKQRINFVTYLRVFAMFCILLCHYVQESANLYIAMSAQFFNIGVQIFFILSGFCFGIQGSIKDCRNWFGKRIKRIYVPYETFLIFLVGIYLITGNSFHIGKLVTCILGVQGTVVGVRGAEHTWFITTLLLCYLVTPILSGIWDRFRNFRIGYRRCLTGILAGFPFLLAWLSCTFVFTLLSPIFFYAIAYILGREYKNSVIKSPIVVGAFVVMCMMFGVRIISKIMWDGTILYDRVFVGYTQYIAAFSILILFMFVFKKRKPGKICNWLNKISFEIYLCHYMFVVGPVSLIHVTPNLVINMIIVTVVSLMTAEVLYRVSEKVRSVFER